MAAAEEISLGPPIAALKKKNKKISLKAFLSQRLIVAGFGVPLNIVAQSVVAFTYWKLQTHVSWLVVRNLIAGM